VILFNEFKKFLEENDIQAIAYFQTKDVIGIQIAKENIDLRDEYLELLKTQYPELEAFVTTGSPSDSNGFVRYEL
jgi:hypothetical protein